MRRAGLVAQCRVERHGIPAHGHPAGEGQVDLINVAGRNETLDLGEGRRIGLSFDQRLRGANGARLDFQIRGPAIG